jgi:general stress protein YciG
MGYFLNDNKEIQEYGRKGREKKKESGYQRMKIMVR